LGPDGLLSLGMDIEPDQFRQWKLPFMTGDFIAHFTLYLQLIS